MSGQRVLVCSTERHVVRLLQVNLERQGYEVQVASSGKDALALLPVDIMVVDSHLGDMTGRELTRQVRDIPETANIRVVLLREANDGDDDDSGPTIDLTMPKPPNPWDVFYAVASKRLIALKGALSRTSGTSLVLP